jgi:hypothetical protein
MKENLMATTTFLAKLGAMAATVAAPAMVFLGAGTALADHDIPLAVWGTSAPGGVNVFVQTPADGLSGWCTYSSFVRGNPIGKPLPAIDVPFYLAPAGGVNSALLWFPSYPTGSTWDTTVSCPNGAMTVPTVW